MTKQITFTDYGITLKVEKGSTILEAARQAGIAVESPCNGTGTCGKCKLHATQLVPAEAVLIKKSIYSSKGGMEGYVLACQACIEEDLSVILGKKEETNLNILSEGRSFVPDVKSEISKQYDAAADHSLVLFHGQYPYAGADVPGPEESPEGVPGDKEPEESPEGVLLAREPGDTREQLYGVTIDIGTTTLVAALIDLSTGREEASESALNPQAHYGQDVLSRISMASEEKGLRTLYQEVIEEINRLIAVVAERRKVPTDQIYEVVFSGNTCMIHLATGVNPESLGRYPYTPVIRGGNLLTARSINVKIAPHGLVYLPPIISAYVGPDITSGVLAAQLDTLKGTTLFVDIGTNGEMVIARDGVLAATSTAAGPAFEGMNIEFGMRAADGAIEEMQVGDDGTVLLKTIGNAPASGICGSGLLDILGELTAHGVINKNGRFVDPEKTALPEELSRRLRKQNGKYVFGLSDTVYLTQKDVRQVQLAKGAVRSGIEFLMKHLGLAADQIDRVYIAGSFGYHLKSSSLLRIRMLPEEFEGKIEYIGNTSKTGGTAFLLNPEYRRKMEGLVRQIEYIELADDKDFQKVFVNSLLF